MRLRRDDLHATSIGDETVVLDTKSSQYLTVNGAGSVLLQALESDTSAEELAGLLVSRFGIDLEQARHDCSAFLHQMREFGFLVE